MTSELRVTTLSNATGDGPAALANQAAAKYFIHFGMNDFVIDQSLNSASVTDEGVGHARLNFTNNMSAPRYSFTGSTNAYTADNTFGSHHAGIGVDYDTCTVKSPTNALGYNTYHSSASIDAVVCNCQTFGDLA
jgi:hypothetical protein